MSTYDDRSRHNPRAQRLRAAALVALSCVLIAHGSVLLGILGGAYGIFVLIRTTLDQQNAAVHNDLMTAAQPTPDQAHTLPEVPSIGTSDNASSDRTTTLEHVVKADDAAEPRAAEPDNTPLATRTSNQPVAMTSSPDPTPLEEAPLLEPEEQDELLAPVSTSKLDFAALSKSLVGASDPLDILKRFVGDIQTRAAEGDPTNAPCGLERFAARQLEDAGLFANDVELPSIDVVRPHASRMVYLRCLDPRIPYLAKLRIIQLEAALNAIRFATASLADDASIEEAYRFNQRLARSVVAQATTSDPWALPRIGEANGGEWAVRYGISQAIESLQLPYRLTANFRCNVADGNVAIEFAHVPAEAFPATYFQDELGLIATTGDLRQQAAADYALRVALLLAASAFRCSERINHVWVADVFENAQRRTCYLSVDFDRWRFARLNLQDLGDLDETYRSFAPVMRHEQGWLRPVQQGFHLEEERFCPSRRYLPVSLSSRRLTGEVATRLGCDHVSALAIEEGDGRTLVANAIMLRLALSDDDHATQKSVRTVLDLAADDPDPTVRSAAERVVGRLVDGTLDLDPLTIGEEFVRGDALTRATDRAKELLMKQQPERARNAIAPLLAQIDAAGLYDDTPTVSYRYFSSYIERALFNRLNASSVIPTTVLLVPDAYYDAHLVVSVCSLMLGSLDDAFQHAQRLCTLAPLNARSRLHLVGCLEALDRDDEAIDELTRLLEIVHDPMSVGMAYYRMAFFQWKQGNVVVAQACYQLAMQFMPQAIPMMAMELSVLYLQNAGELSAEISREQAEKVLSAHGIPVAPTQETSDAFYECAQASLDAEIFPVARNFAHVLSAFSGDDIITGLMRSLEDAPDH